MNIYKVIPHFLVLFFPPFLSLSPSLLQIHVEFFPLRNFSLIKLIEIEFFYALKYFYFGMFE